MQIQKNTITFASVALIAAAAIILSANTPRDAQAQSKDSSVKPRNRRNAGESARASQRQSQRAKDSENNVGGLIGTLRQHASCSDEQSLQIQNAPQLLGKVANCHPLTPTGTEGKPKRVTGLEPATFTLAT